MNARPVNARPAFSHLRLQIEDFDDLPLRPASVAEPCACPRCEADPRGLRCHGETYEEGVRAGQAMRAAADQDSAARLALELSDALAAADAQVAEIAEDAAEAVGQAVLAMAAALLPASLARHGPSEVRAIAAALLPSLVHAPSLTVDVAADAEDDIRAAIERLPPSQRARIDIRRHPPAEPGSLSVAWSGGALHRDTEVALQNIRTILAELGLTAPAPQPEKALIHG